jgi:hypothetical protein
MTTTTADALTREQRERLADLIAEGQRVWKKFDAEVRSLEWHPFIPADYEAILRQLIPLRDPGARFLELGSATGVIAIMADMLGFEAYGIELDEQLVDIARGLATKFGSGARFAAGTFLPDDYHWASEDGDERLGTIGDGVAAYAELGHSLDEFDYIFQYPWGGEEPIIQHLVRTRAPTARLLLNGGGGIRIFRGGVLQS